jgi:hypothetical protein
MGFRRTSLIIAILEDDLDPAYASAFHALIGEAVDVRCLANAKRHRVVSTAAVTAATTVAATPFGQVDEDPILG